MAKKTKNNFTLLFLLISSLLLSCSKNDGSLEMISENQNKEDFSIFLTKYEELPSDDPGYKLIEIQIALRNNTKDTWAEVDRYFTSFPVTLTSSDGFTYKSHEYRETCEYHESRERDSDDIRRVCSSGISGGGDFKPIYGIIPPGFQVLFVEEEWKVAEAVSNFTYDLELPIYVGNEKQIYDFTLELDNNNIQAYTTPFINNMSWSDYKKWGVKNSLILNPGDSYSDDFGKLTFSNSFELDKSVTGFYYAYMDVEVQNASKAYELELKNPNATSCLIGPDYTYGCLNNATADVIYVNPAQTASFRVDQMYHSYDVNIPETVKFPTCFFAPDLKWEINNEKYEKEFNLIICEE
jgi:hypothetical protein